MEGRDLFAEETGGRDLFAEEPQVEPTQQLVHGTPQEQQPKQPGATISRESLSDAQRPYAEELERRGVLSFGDLLKDAPSANEIVNTTNQMSVAAFEPAQVLPGGGGIGEGVAGITEPAMTIGSGAVSEIASGFAALRTLLETGDIDQAKKVVGQFQEQFTHRPKTDAGKATLSAAGKLIKPVADVAGKFVKGAGDFAYDVAGPTAGAITETSLRMVPELLGLKINKAAKLKLVKKAIGDAPSGLYDELGNILPEIKKGLDDSGIDIDEFKTVISEPLKQEDALRGTAGQISDAATSRGDKKALKIAEEARPDKEILQAAEELGVGGQLLPSHTAQNPVYVALEQGLKSIPGSQLAASERAVISELGKKADELILEFGGEVDKSLLSEKFRTQTADIIDSIGKKESELFSEINDNLPIRFGVKTDNIINSLKSKADDLGGTKYLDKTEQLLLKDLSQKAKPTYARLDKYRKLIGSAFKNKGPWKDADQGALKQMYKSLAEDQKTFAKTQGYEDLYKTANSLTVQRKGLEDQLVKVIGKDLTGSISAKGKNAILGLQKGDTKLFNDLSKNIPKEVGKEARQSVFVTALNDAFTQGSRKERSLNIPGFDDFMTGLNRNKVAKAKLKGEIGEQAVKRLETLHKVVSGIRKAQEQAITTGRIAAVPKMFDEVDNIATKLYGVGKAASLAKGAVVGVVEAAINAKRTPRSVAADELLNSRKFQDMINKKAKNALDTEAKVKRADEIIGKLKEYKKWEDTIPPKELKDVATVGVIGYLTGEKEKE